MRLIIAMVLAAITFPAIAIADGADGSGTTKPSQIVNLAGQDITSRNGFVLKTPGVLNRQNMIRITTLDFAKSQKVDGYAFTRIAMAFDQDNPATLAVGADARADYQINTDDGTTYYWNGQVAISNGNENISIELYAGKDGDALGKLASVKLEKETDASGSITFVDDKQQETTLPLLKFKVGDTLMRCVFIADAKTKGQAGASTQPSAATPPSGPLAAFVGKWIDQDQKDQSVVITSTDIQWNRGFDDGPEVISSSSCKADGNGGVTFTAASSSGVGMLVGGKLVRPTATDAMALSGDTLTISEGSATGEDPSSGFGFTTVAAPIKHVFKKAQ